MAHLIYNTKRDKNKIEIATVKGFEMTRRGVYVGNFVGKENEFQSKLF